MKAAAARRGHCVSCRRSFYDRGMGTHIPDLEVFETEEAAALLTRLGVPADDLVLVLAQRPDYKPSLDLVVSFARTLIENMGTFHELSRWPARDDFLYVWVFLAALPAVREYHAKRAIPDDVSWV